MTKKNPTTPKVTSKRTEKKKVKVKKEKPKMNYATVGTIRSVDLSNHTFKLDPISKYRFEVKDGDENSWKVAFAEESNSDPDDLRLVPKDTSFPFDVRHESAMIVLKQGKGKIKVVIEESHLTDLIKLAKANGEANNNLSENAEPASGSEEGQKTGENEKKNRETVKIEVL